MAALVAVSVVPLAGGDVGKLAVMAGIMAVLMGFICILGSFLRLGFMADFLAKPVIVGFMHGLAMVIFVGQLPKVFGIKGEGVTTLAQLATVYRNIGGFHWVSFALGASCVAIILGFRRWIPRVPGQIVALLAALLAVYFFGLERYGVVVVGHIPQGLPHFNLPLPSVEDFHTILPVAFAAALVAFSDTMVTARGFASRNRYPINANQELFALGLSNITSGLTQGLPVSASGSRTAVAESAGSRSQVTSIFAALVVAGVMLFFTPYLYYLPSAALGGILIAAAYNLCEFQEFTRMWRFRGVGFVGALLTFGGVVGIGVMEGIGIGVGFSLILLVRELAFPDDAVLGRVSEEEFHDRRWYPQAQLVPGLILYRFSGPLFFANCGLFRSRIEELIGEASEPVKGFILDASGIINLDLAACELLSEIQEELQGRGIQFGIANLRDYVRALLIRGWEGAGREKGLFPPSLAAAVRDISQGSGR